MSAKHWIELGFAAAIVAALLAPWLRKKGSQLSDVINEIDRDNQR